MTKTFKSGANTNCEATVTRHRIGASIRVVLDGMGISRFTVGTSDAAKFMLAIAEGSGVTPAHADEWTVGEPDNLARIAADLQRHIEARDLIAKADADRDALESEAWDLYCAAFPDGHPYPKFDRMPVHLGEAWVRVALKAREMRPTNA